VLTAAVLLPLLVGTILYGKGLPFTLFVGASALLCAAEYFRMFFPAARDRRAGVVLTVMVYASGALLPFPAAFSAVLACVALAAFHFLAREGAPGDKVREAGLFVLGTVYVGGFFSAYPRTMALPGGEHWVITGLVAVAAGDTFAYFTGRAFGRRPLSPRVSPNKTVEGAAGGFAASFLPSVPWWFALSASAVVGAVGQAGDLFESLLKRAAGVKDSGSLLPGHGGMLDRSDALIAVAPALHLLASISPLAGTAG